MAKKSPSNISILKNVSKKDIEKRFAKEWDNLPISNDFLFSLIMRKKELCLRFLQLFLNVKIRDLRYVAYEKTIKLTHDLKSIRLDMYIEDDERVYNIEMQSTNSPEFAKRIRFYQGLIDKGKRIKKI